MAFFLKNSTNLYIFRKNKWFEVAPGAGIKLYYKNLAIDFGLERKFQMVEKRKPGYEDGFFFSLTGYIMN